MNKDKLIALRDDLLIEAGMNNPKALIKLVIDAILEERSEQWIPPEGCPVYVGKSFDIRISAGTITTEGRLNCYQNNRKGTVYSWTHWEPIPGVTFNEDAN